MAQLAYCGTNDLQSVYPAYQSLMGTGTDAGYPFYIDRASDWFAAQINGFTMSPPQLDPATGSYDYWVRRCVADYAVYLCADGVLSEQLEVGEDGWWSKHETRAMDVITGMKNGEYRQAWETSMWERGIGPAMPTANGTVPAPPMVVCNTNHRLTGESYYGDMDRNILVELDGTGSTSATQTFRWKERDGTAWEYEGLSCSTGSWTSLDWGVRLYWMEPQAGTLAQGMRWTIPCHTLSRPEDGPGIVARSLKYGL